MKPDVYVFLTLTSEQIARLSLARRVAREGFIILEELF